MATIAEMVAHSMESIEPSPTGIVWKVWGGEVAYDVRGQCEAIASLRENIRVGVQGVEGRYDFPGRGQRKGKESCHGRSQVTTPDCQDEWLGSRSKDCGLKCGVKMSRVSQVGEVLLEHVGRLSRGRGAWGLISWFFFLFHFLSSYIGFTKLGTKGACRISYHLKQPPIKPHRHPGKNHQPTFLWFKTNCTPDTPNKKFNPD